MTYYWVKTNSIVKKIFSNYTWDIPTNEKKIYLTFDDGPTPEITKWVLEKLEKHNAKATFFCIGKNIESYPQIFRETIHKGHTIGNHTFDHLNGWKTTAEQYIENIVLCENSISNHNNKIKGINQKLFRPPYGKIKPALTKKLRMLGYQIIMWDILSADFDQTITKEKCLKNVISNINPGSIIVFHDSVKAFKNLEYILPRILEYLDKNNYCYETI